MGTQDFGYRIRDVGIQIWLVRAADAAKIGCTIPSPPHDILPKIDAMREQLASLIRRRKRHAAQKIESIEF